MDEGWLKLVKAPVRRAGIRRSHLAATRMACERMVLGAGLRTKPCPTGRILCYHSVGTPDRGTNDLSAARFRRHLSLALESGYQFVSAERIARGQGRSNELGVTFDDGWMSVYTIAAPILSEFKVPATLFVVSDWAEGNHGIPPGQLLGWHEVEYLAANGFTIGSHSATHSNLSTLSEDQLREELFGSRRRIADRIGTVPDAFAIPFGRSRDWTPKAGAIAQTAGYSTIYAACTNRRPSGTIARSFVTRFDNDRVFRSLCDGAFDGWEEWF